MSGNIIISKSSKEIKKDIKDCKDNIKKVILQEILKVKLDEESSNMKLDDVDIDNKNVSTHMKKILKEQQDSLDKIYKMQKVKAYEKLLEDNEKEETNNMLKDKRGKLENEWENSNIIHNNNPFDPNYAKYIASDVNNNKLMERLNCEIDFRSDTRKNIVIKPFDNNDIDDPNDPFAKFINDGQNQDRKYKKKDTKKLGTRKDLF